MPPISTQDFERLLRPYLEMIHITLDAAQISALTIHLNLLLRWNQKLNLTAVRTPPEMIKRHFAESLFLANLLELRAGTTIADIGSGAGFPGFPISVLRPSAQVSLIESVAKKVAFLKELCRGRPNVSVIHARFEQLAASFDWGVVRGVLASQLLQDFATSLRHVALIVGREATRDLSSAPTFEWGEPVPLPWKPDPVVLRGRSRTFRLEHSTK